MANQTSKSKLVASLLSHSWRESPSPPQLSDEELAGLVPLLLGSGAGPLGWRRIRSSNLRETPAAIDLQQAYKLHAIHASVFEDRIKKVITLLRSAHVDPVLIKGWAVARLYSDTVLRPYGDVDLCVRRSEYAAAADACDSDEGQRYLVDLHDRFDKSDSLTTEEMYDRSQLYKLGDVEVRVPCAEHHLRIMSLHMLRHGAWRPLWLCDIAVAIENRPPDFDWDLCLGRNKRIADRVVCCIGLAHELLGAEVGGTPVDRSARRLPAWLVSNVLKQWETPYSTAQAPMTHQAEMTEYLRRPKGLLADLRRRWPNPIEATVYVGGPFNELPRWPFQFGECVVRAAKFVGRLPKTFRETKQ